MGKIGCTGYARDDTIAPGSKESGSYDLRGGVTAQLYLMPNLGAGQYLIDIAKQRGIATRTSSGTETC